MNALAKQAVALAFCAGLLLPKSVPRAAEEPNDAGIADRILAEHLREFDDAEEREATHREIRELFAPRLRELNAVLEREPEARGEINEQVGRIVDHAAELAELRRERPDAYERETRGLRLENRVHELADACRKAAEPDRKAAADALRDAVAELFDMRLEALQAEVRELETHLVRLSELAETRARRRDELIERRVRDITLGPEDRELMEW